MKNHIIYIVNPGVLNSDFVVKLSNSCSCNSVRCLYYPLRNVQLLSSRLFSTFFYPLYFLLFCLFARVTFKKKVFFLIFSQPPLVQPILCLIARFFSFQYSLVVYDFYPVFIQSLSRFAFFRIFLSFYRYLYTLSCLKALKIVVLSCSMKNALLTYVRKPLATIVVEYVSRHNLYPDPSSLTPTISSSPPFADIVYSGSYSSSQSLVGFSRLVKNSPPSFSFAVSSSIYKALINSSLLPHVFLSKIKVIPFLSSDAYTSLLTSCSFGFVSLSRNCDPGFCFPSRLFSYVAHGLPVLFDGESSSIDNILDDFEIGYCLEISSMSDYELSTYIGSLYTLRSVYLNSISSFLLETSFFSPLSTSTYCLA